MTNEKISFMSKKALKQAGNFWGKGIDSGGGWRKQPTQEEIDCFEKRGEGVKK